MRRRALREAWARFVRDERGGLFVPNTNLARMIPLDASDLLYWPMTEDAAPFANAGNAGALTLSGTSGTPTVRRTGLFGRGAVDMNGNSGGTTDSLASAATSVGETAGVWSISVWCLFRTFPAQFSSLFGKQYRGDGTWTSPFTSCKLGMTNAANGTWDVNVTIAGAGQDLAISGKSDRCTLNRWHFLAGTFDGNVLRAYLDGSLVGTSSSLGTNVATDWGTHGRWYCGGNPQSTGDWFDGRITAPRFSKTVRSEAFFMQQYKYALGLWE